MRASPTDTGRHLDETELVDVLDGALSPGRRAHLTHCDACRDRADGLTQMLTRAADVEIPEPPAEFWDQFSTRIREAVGREAPASALPTVWVRWAGLAAAAVLVLALVLTRPDGRAPRPAEVVPPQDAGTFAATAAGVGDAAVDDADEAWALVRAVADGLLLEEVHAAGIDASPGSANRAAAALSEGERLALAQLLDDEIKGRGRSEPFQ